MSFGSSKSKGSSKTKSEPWAPTIDPAKAYIDKINQVGGLDITPDQMAAFGQLKENAGAGNPFTPQIAKLAEDAFNYSGGTENKAMVSDAYAGLQGNLGAYANGDYLDVMNNPQMREMLDMVAGNVQDRINRSFHGMGRSRSGINQQSVSRGITEGQLPLLLDQFNKQQGLQMDAAKALYGAGGDTATTLNSMGQNDLNVRSSGIGLAEQALAARDYAPNKILDLDQQIQQLPYENLALYGSLLLPAAGLGGTSDTKSKSKTSGFSISDERMKDDIQEVGALADGSAVYSFTYKDDPDDRVHIGLMAQEVEKKTPEAVKEFGGVKAVNYGMATERAAQIVARQLAKRKGK